MILGFTGTQVGMTEEQKDVVGGLVWDWYPDEVHHGDCMGADEQFHYVVGYIRTSRERKGIKIVIHPPDNPIKRAYCSSLYVEQPLPYLVRNRNIVYRSNRLLAAPKEFEEQLRSGTWSTIRYALKIGRRVVVVWPDGKYDLDFKLPEKL